MVKESNDYLAGLPTPPSEAAPARSLSDTQAPSHRLAPSHRTKTPAPTHRVQPSNESFTDTADVDDLFGFEEHKNIEETSEPGKTGRTAVVKPQKSKRLLWLGAFFAIVLGVGFFAKLWIDKQLDPSGEPRTAVDIQIPQGSSSGQIGDILEQKAIIPSSRAFGYYTKYKKFNDFQAGDYVLQENMSVYEAIAVLDAGPADPVSPNFSVNEGLWVSEALQEIAKDVPGVTVADLEAVLASDSITPKYRPEGVTSWEGLLFPAKYDFTEGTTAREAISLMNNKFNEVAAEAGLDDPSKLRGYTPYEIIIIASLVEAEALHDEDRPQIAGVIYNRLEGKGGGAISGLQIDASILYGANDRDPGILTRDFIDTFDSPYNLHAKVSLPPTPIAAPGRAAIAAALNPAESDDLYYVVKDSQGYHLFTSDYDEFINQKNKSRDEGVIQQ